MNPTPALPLAGEGACAPAAAPVLDLDALVGLGWRHPHHAEVLAQRPNVGFLEVHSENFFGDGGAALALLGQARALYPISLHGVGLSLGAAVGLDADHLETLARLVERIDPVRVSDHASFARGYWRDPPSLIHAADLLPVPYTHEALAVMVRHVQQVQERLQRPIAVENLSAYVQWAQADWSEPDFLTELARRSGCALLVDVNNLMVNALNADGAPQVYGAPGHAATDDSGGVPNQAALCDRLVARCTAWLDCVGADVCIAELHLAGHTHTGDMVIDDHGQSMAAPTWAVYRHALRRWGAVPSLIEWDTNIPPLSVLLEEVALARTHAQAVWESS